MRPHSPPLLDRLRPGHWLLFDALAVIPCTFIAMGMMTPHPLRAQVPPILLAAVVCALPIVLRRSQPVYALALTLLLLVAVATARPRTAVLFLLPTALTVYSSAANRRPQVSLPALVLAIAGTLAVVLPASPKYAGPVLGYILLLVTVWTVGYSVGLHRSYTHDLLKHHAALAEGELAKARQQTMEDRLRIAREMHDVVAHTMSVINVQAGYGHFVIDQHPDQARAVLDTICTTSRDAIQEMRGLLSILRADDPHHHRLEPAPRLRDLGDLIARTADAGVHVDLRITGDQHDLPTGIELTAYRIVQEALTNVVRHAATDTARVVIEHQSDALSIDVTDDGKGTTTVHASGGHGLAGMRERVQLYGGHLSAAPLPGGGFRVAARLPFRDGAI